MEEDQKLNVRLVGRDGRRWYDPASKARLVAACLEGGVSVSRLALEHGINANLLKKWIKAAEETGTVQSSSTPAFVPFLAVDRGGSVRLNSSGRFVRWISASIMLPPGLASAH